MRSAHLGSTSDRHFSRAYVVLSMWIQARQSPRRASMTTTSSSTSAPPSFLGTRRGKLTLVLLSAVAFIDLLDGSIMNVAIPQIQDHLHFSVQNPQWIASAYLLTYGGFLLL